MFYESEQKLPGVGLVLRFPESNFSGVLIIIHILNTKFERLASFVPLINDSC